MQFLQSIGLARIGMRTSASPIAFASAVYLPGEGVSGEATLENKATGVKDLSIWHALNNHQVNLTGIYSTSGATITIDAAAGPETGLRAILVTNTNTTGISYCNVFNCPAGTYTLWFEARADTPVSIKSGKNGSEEVISITSDWQTFSVTMTQTSLGLLQIYLTRYNAANFSVLIAKVRVGVGTEDPGAPPVNGWPLSFGSDAYNNVPTLPAASWAANAAIQFGRLRSFNAVSGVMQLTGGASPSASAYIITAENTNTRFSLRMNATRRISFNFTGAGEQAFTRFAGVNNGETAIIEWSAGQSGMVLLRNKLPVLVKTYALTAFNASYFSLPVKNTLGTGAGVGAMALFDRELTGDQLRLLDTWAVAEATKAGASVTVPDTGYYPCGDSITHFDTASDTALSYAQQIFPNTAGLVGTTVAWPGQNLTQQETEIDRYIPYWSAAIAAGRTIIVSLMIGRNDSGALVSDWSAYMDRVKLVAAKIKATGAKLIMCDILPCDVAGFNTARALYNAQLAADEGDWFDVHADFSGVAAGQDGAESNLTYYSDGTHPTQAGHDNLYPVMQSAYDVAAA